MTTPPIFGEAAQALIACNQKLQELGIDRTIKLPRIVVVGDQSTGKSSLIESISTIEVPKASGLCTKCPIAINLSNSQDPKVPWKCTVYVEEKFSYNARQRKINSVHPLGPWTAREEMRLTYVANTQSQVELIKLIDAAQRLVLDPERINPHESNIPVERLQTFSPNTIRLDIEATGWVNLSFVDLPGVIARAGQNLPAYSVDLVESLARQYAKDKNNVVLLTLPLNHDVDNSRAYGLVEKEMAHSRTIAVFTKVDLASDEQRKACLEQYFNPSIKDEFGHGQHMVMLSEANEEEYFNDEPWSGQSDAVQGKLGVANLVDRIRNILFKETKRTLPENLKSINVRLEAIDGDLLTMPPPPDAVSLPWKLREQLMIFDGHAKQLFALGSASRNMLQKRMQTFSSGISKYEPTLKYKTRGEQRAVDAANERLRKANESEAIVSEDDDSEVSPVDATTILSKPTTLKSYQFKLEGIRTLNRELYQSDVAGEIEPKALDKMNKLAVQYWKAGLENFITRIQDLVTTQVEKCIESDFGHQKHLPLYVKVQETAKMFMVDVFATQKQILEHKCDAETTTPFTLDQAYHKQLMRKILEDRQKTREEVRVMVANAIQKAEYAGTKKKPKPVDANSLGPDEYDQELVMFAKTAAYYELASKRFVDSCCQDILTHLVPAFHTGFTSFIAEQLGLDNMEKNKDSIAELMAEDPEREERRRHLLKEKENLSAGRMYITNVLSTEVGDDGTSVHSDAYMSDDDPFTAASGRATVGGSVTSASSKRKNHATVENDPEESPTKKTKNNIAVREPRRSLRLPSRARSVETDNDDVL